METDTDDIAIHLVISSNLWQCLDKTIPNCKSTVGAHSCAPLLGMVMDAAFMLQTSSVRNISPEDCRLRVMLTVGEEQPDLDEV